MQFSAAEQNPEDPAADPTRVLGDRTTSRTKSAAGSRKDRFMSKVTVLELELADKLEQMHLLSQENSELQARHMILSQHIALWEVAHSFLARDRALQRSPALNGSHASTSGVAHDAFGGDGSMPGCSGGSAYDSMPLPQFMPFGNASSMPPSSSSPWLAYDRDMAALVRTMDAAGCVHQLALYTSRLGLLLPKCRCPSGAADGSHRLLLVQLQQQLQRVVEEHRQFWWHAALLAPEPFAQSLRCDFRTSTPADDPGASFWSHVLDTMQLSDHQVDVLVLNSCLMRSRLQQLQQAQSTVLLGLSPSSSHSQPAGELPVVSQLRDQVKRMAVALAVRGITALEALDAIQHAVMFVEAWPFFPHGVVMEGLLQERRAAAASRQHERRQ